MRKLFLQELSPFEIPAKVVVLYEVLMVAMMLKHLYFACIILNSLPFAPFCLIQAGRRLCSRSNLLTWPISSAVLFVHYSYLACMVLAFLDHLWFCCKLIGQRFYKIVCFRWVEASCRGHDGQEGWSRGTKQVRICRLLGNLSTCKEGHGISVNRIIGVKNV